MINKMYCVIFYIFLLIALIFIKLCIICNLTDNVIITFWHLTGTYKLFPVFVLTRFKIKRLTQPIDILIIYFNNINMQLTIVYRTGKISLLMCVTKRTLRYWFNIFTFTHKSDLIWPYLTLRNWPIPKPSTIY